MPKLTVKDLETIRDRVSKEMSLRLAIPKVKIWVHMGETGIESGAREIMDAILSELDRSGRKDIQVFTSDRIEESSGEPNLTIETEGNPPVVYHKITPETARLIFQNHAVKGCVMNEHVMPPVGCEK
ncbi:MAG: (2Fe-2S) ferredoxin domain-containing protein [Thermodesulfobacteriota bacterium]